MSQQPLSLRFETKLLWKAFEAEIGVAPTGAAIILDICNADGWISYSRTARHYEVPKRYRNGLYTYRKVVSQVDYLDQQGLIDHDRRPPGERGWQSALRATDDLRGIHAKILGTSVPTLARPAEVILLRDADGNLLDYRNTRDLDRKRKQVIRFNEAIAGAGLDASVVAPLARIYNQTSKRGGRHYAMGPSWQNLPSEARRAVTISGEPVVELDYKTLHPAILYAEAGATMPSDCYEIAGWPRKLVKVALLILINAQTPHQARHALAHADPMEAVAPLGSQAALRAAGELIDAIKVMHRPIAHAFHSDAGARLMTIDSDIASCVMSDMLDKGVVALPVHDSFLVPASKRDLLEEVMLKAANQAGLWMMSVSQK
ncbi:hypothetical protein RGQ15_14155 [Paracoccus sp. MBLB3053]|uniref:DNA-directed RNA polymerase n=1 Tax=Paracoccus aurantius TaxID=3073814 RepID=A0ABU2HW15_9RHOB|nr:hypothetical protein [Paracoccus sp. MBLB3053]MDS9468705.1 hypothetical protein [Paracoccus sp. MBLB3053]